MKCTFLLTCICFIIFTDQIIAQDSITEFHPSLTITIKTLDGHWATDVELLDVSATELIYYHDFTGETYQLPYYRIKKIKTKLKGGVGLGAMLGLLGSGGLAAFYLHQASKSYESLDGSGRFLGITVGLGTLIGTMIGTGLKKKYKIKGDHKRFLKFKKAYEIQMAKKMRRYKKR